MKNNFRKAITVLVAVIIASLFVVCVVAESFESFDCFDVSDELKESICEKDEQIIKYYNGAFMYGFALNEALDTLTGSEYVLETIIATYAGEQNEVTSRYSIRTGAPVRLSDGKKYDGSQFFVDYTSKETINRMQKKLNGEIKNILCLNGSASADGIYICYVTDVGDYVLFKEHETSEETYLFPIEEFAIYAKTYQEELHKHLYSENGHINKGGGFHFSDVSGVENYEFNIDNDRTIIIISLSLVAITIVTLSIVLVKKHKHRNRVSFAQSNAMKP